MSPGYSEHLNVGEWGAGNMVSSCFEMSQFYDCYLWISTGGWVSSSLRPLTGRCLPGKIRSPPPPRLLGFSPLLPVLRLNEKQVIEGEGWEWKVGCEDFWGASWSLWMKQCCLWKWRVEKKVPIDSEEGGWLELSLQLKQSQGCGTSVVSLTLLPPSPLPPLCCVS